MKIVSKDRDWAGGTVVVTSEPEKLIEEWRKEFINWAVEGNKNHKKSQGANPWPKHIERSSTIENFMEWENIQIHDIVEGLTIDFRGDA